MSFDLGIKNTKIGGEVNYLDSEKIRFISRGITIDASKVRENEEGQRIVKAGSRMAKISDTDLYCPVKVAEVFSNASSSQKDVEVHKGHNLQVGDVLANVGTIASVDTSPADHDVLTFESNISSSLDDGDDIKAEDGSEKALLIMHPHDINVTESEQVSCGGFDWGRVIEGRLPGYVTDTEKNDLSEIKFV